MSKQDIWDRLKAEAELGKRPDSGFKDKFEVCDETGSFLYKTDACSRRHNRPRAEMNLTVQENARYDITSRKVFWSEQSVQNEYATTKDMDVLLKTAIPEPEYWT